jgi:hypothetical protein
MRKVTFPILISALASVVTSAVFQVTIQVRDGWIRSHLPPFMPYLWALCGALWLCWVIAKIVSRQSEAAPIPLPGNSAGRDNLGQQIIAGRDVYVHSPVERHAEGRRDVPSGANPLPSLRCSARWIDAVYEVSPGRWIKLPGPSSFAEKMAVAIFENPSAPKEQVGIPLKQIEANLKFYSSVENVTVNAAYWLESDNSLMDIPAGHERTIILGHFEGDAREKFISYENRYTVPDRSRRPVRQLGDPIPIVAAHNIRVDVTLIDRNHRTVEKATIEIALMTQTIQVLIE